MKNAINTLRIRNFKSIKDVTISPRRVNLIIGEPNVGKSNVLEAMSLLGGMVYEQQPKFMAGMVRYEQAHQLFYDSIITETIQIESNIGSCLAGSYENRNTYRAFYFNDAAYKIYEPLKNHISFNLLDEQTLQEMLKNPQGSKNTPYQLQIRKRLHYGMRSFNENGDSPSIGRTGFDNRDPNLINTIFVRPYMFSKYNHVFESNGFNYLRPPHGTNLKAILQANSTLFEKINELFKQDGYRLGMRVISNELEAVRLKRGIIYSIPYTSIADTLQRLIFYLAAIESNDDAVILFEEPEAHSYPVYVSQLGRRIAESRNNQFFVATHSPYLITEILETMLPDKTQAKQLAIFVAYYEDYQTKLRQLSDEEVRSIRADGLDVFYNMDRFVNPKN